MDRQPRLLTIAGSDSGGGAGIQADLKTFSALGCFGMSAITAVTAQNTLGVTASQALPPDLVSAQIRAVISDIGVDAIKIGMVANAGIVEAIAAELENMAPVALVLDPVMVATSGDVLIDDEAVEALQALLFPRTTLLTPNLPEASRLLGREIGTAGELISGAKELGAQCSAVLIKGAHSQRPGATADQGRSRAVAAGGRGEEIVDLLWDGERAESFRHPRIDSTSDHGTGCTLSAAAAAHLALGRPLIQAVGAAIEFVQHAMRNAFGHGQGRGPLNHEFRRAAPSGGAS